MQGSTYRSDEEIVVVKYVDAEALHESSEL